MTSLDYQDRDSSFDDNSDENHDWEEIGLDVDDFKIVTKFTDDRIIHENYCWESVTTEWEQKCVIGTGGFATVFLQKEVGKARLRAVKRMDRLGSYHFDRELGVLVQARDHKNLFVEFFGWYEDKPNNFTFIVMEYLPLGDLNQYIQKSPADSKENSREITKQLLQALKVLHEKGIIHRDLKPQNVLIASITPILVKVTDFGVSRALTEDNSMTIIGTQAYMAPEILGFLPPYRPLKRYTFAVDVWALGCIVHELLTTKSPFKSTGYITFDPLLPSDAVEAPLLEDYCSGKSDFSWALRTHASDGAIYFVKKLLVADPDSRMKIADALDLYWLLGSPNNAFQITETMKRQLMSIEKELEYDDRPLPEEDDSGEDISMPAPSTTGGNASIYALPIQMKW